MGPQRKHTRGSLTTQVLWKEFWCCPPEMPPSSSKPLQFKSHMLIPCPTGTLGPWKPAHPPPTTLTSSVDMYLDGVRKLSGRRSAPFIRGTERDSKVFSRGNYVLVRANMDSIVGFSRKWWFLYEWDEVFASLWQKGESMCTTKVCA